MLIHFLFFNNLVELKFKSGHFHFNIVNNFDSIKKKFILLELVVDNIHRFAKNARRLEFQLLMIGLFLGLYLTGLVFLLSKKCIFRASLEKNIFFSIFAAYS